MAHTVISSNLPPNIDLTKAPLAYGDRALPKLNKELNDDTLIVRQRALVALCDVLHNPEHISESIRVGIITSLKKLLKDADPTVRIKTTEALHVMAGHAIGRDAILEHKVVLPLSKLFDDEVYKARRQSHMAILMVTQSPPGPEGVVGVNLVPILVGKLLTEEDEIKEVILDTLHFCMKVNTDQALSSNAMEAFTKLLSHTNANLRSKAARDIMDLSFPLDGKDAACDAGAVPILSQLLTEQSTLVKASAAGALMAISITTRGKYAAIEAGTISRLVALLHDESSEVRLNALKTITELSEAPPGRTELLKSLKEVEKLVNDNQSAAVRKAARIAVQTITWKP
ncbi:radial spoke head 14 homolog [Rhopilema esculentum]|uniref:radial spoke head 14 homolog n=1 Tax=Rhopilema esculentum TaxID=499914 RepID=UPI0031DD6115|eukprot:gene12627-3333_t